MLLYIKEAKGILIRQHEAAVIRKNEQKKSTFYIMVLHSNGKANASISKETMGTVIIKCI